ncbi:hypothetical protein DN402_02790 [Streptomyces sp. SW4]|nr:hypothetical protein DN402_02790 [Streptomyces sp. SW4]
MVHAWTGGPGKHTHLVAAPNADPMIVEAEQLTDGTVKVSSRTGFQIVADSLLVSHTAGFTGRAWVLPVPGRATRLRVDADAQWSMRVRTSRAAQPLLGSRTGRGPDVLIYTGPDTDAQFTHTEEKDAFGIGGTAFLWCLPLGWGNSTSRKDVHLLTAGDDLHAPVRLPGPCLLFVQADFSWTITAVPPR